MSGMRKINFGIFAILALTAMRVFAYVNETLYTKGFVVIVISVVGGNAIEHAKDLVGIFTIKKAKPKK